MKLRNLLLTAALIFTASAVYADVYHTDNNYFWNNDTNSKSVTITLTKDGQTGFHYAAYDVAQYSTLGNFSFSDLESNPTKYAGKVWLLSSGDNTINLTPTIEQIGIIGTSGNSDNQLVFSSANVSASNQYHFYGNTVSIMSYGKEKGQGTHAADISFGASNDTFGSPLPTPVVTLLIALAIGAGFVMYRSRKQQAEA